MKGKGKVNAFEHTTIEMTNPDIFFNSRLACCIKLKPYMNEMIVTQPLHHDTDQHYNKTRFYADGQASNGTEKVFDAMTDKK